MGAPSGHVGRDSRQDQENGKANSSGSLALPRASLSPAPDYRSRTNLSVKVLDFVKFGGPSPLDLGAKEHGPGSRER